MNKSAYEVSPFLNHHSYNIFFSNLANPLKIGIILSLRERAKNVTEITKDLVVEQSKISHSLASLKSCNIVNVKKMGKERVYSLNKNTIIPMLELLNKHANIHCNSKTCMFNCNKK